MTISSDSRGNRVWLATPFPCMADINERISLFEGNIEELTADAIVNPTNENLTQLDYVSKLTGQELDAYIRRKVKACATGDVRLTPGFKSNFKYIIHAVPPKYQPKYKTAAETALYHTYFRVLELMIENKLRTVVFPTLTTTKCNLPIEVNCNMQLRVIRRLLEKKLDEFDKIILHVQDVEQYKNFFYCYFPRNAEDEENACYKLDHSIGGPNGEPVIPEREIRIKSKPASASLNDDDNSVDLTSGLDLSTVVGKTPFSLMRDDLDKQRSEHGSTSNNGFQSIYSPRRDQLALRKPRHPLGGCSLL